MSGSNVDIKRFDSKGDFSLWKRMINTYLSVSGLKDVLGIKNSSSKTTSEDIPKGR